MKYFVTFPEDKDWDVLDDNQLRHLIDTAVINNKDISEFGVTAISTRLTETQAKFIGRVSGLEGEIKMEMDKGSTPYEAVMEWIEK